MINFEVMQKCKRGVYIINVGRGGLVNEKDLLNALKSGHVYKFHFILNKYNAFIYFKKTYYRLVEQH